MRLNYKLGIIGILIIILFSVVFLETNRNILRNTEQNISEVCINDNCFSVELAKTIEEKQIGLMNRTRLDKNKGTLFIYQAPSKQSFWMKNTLIPLDIIWIDKDYRVVHIETAQPCKKDQCEIYSPNEDSLYILEINANLTKELKIKEGEIVKINLK